MNGGESIARRLRLDAGLARLAWVPNLLAMVVGVVYEGIRPLTWRRTARSEFFRWLDISARGPLVAAVAVGALMGLSLVLQSLQILRELGGQDLLRSIVVSMAVEQLAPVAVGALVMGRTGILLYEELAASRRSGELAARAAMGVEPLLVVVAPRVAAIAGGAFAHFVFLVAATLLVGFSAAKAMGVQTGSLAFSIDSSRSARSESARRRWLSGRSSQASTPGLRGASRVPSGTTPSSC